MRSGYKMEGVPSKILGRATLMAHDLRFRRFHPEAVSFNLPALTSRVPVGKSLKTSFYVNFPENELISLSMRMS